MNTTAAVELRRCPGRQATTSGDGLTAGHPRGTVCDCNTRGPGASSCRESSRGESDFFGERDWWTDIRVVRVPRGSERLGSVRGETRLAPSWPTGKFTPNGLTGALKTKHIYRAGGFSPGRKTISGRRLRSDDVSHSDVVPFSPINIWKTRQDERPKCRTGGKILPPSPALPLTMAGSATEYGGALASRIHQDTS